MLVQIFLRILYIENTDLGIRSQVPPLPDSPDIVVDGIFGPVTSRYVLHFKNQARQQGVKLYPDEIMDPFRHNEPDSLSTISKSRYAFGALLNITARADEKSELGKFDVLPEHKDTPSPLKLALTQTRREAQQYGG